ncbi:hypothetical protein HELRODRAFT_129255, partial [Helobdella robusta]|uniref:Ig-like domain-containing protein n=1 Tax=Helobdella robusta TaxID=6412 RepID=T1EHR5_HELRO
LGDEIFIKCKLSPSSKNQVTWFKDGQPLSELKDGRIKINSNSESGIQTLKIAKALWEDVGDLVMIAENENGIVECTVPINVLSKTRNESLKIDQFICPSLIKTGGLLEINCHVSAMSSCLISWMKNDEQLVEIPSARTLIGGGVVNYIFPTAKVGSRPDFWYLNLIIFHVRKEDAGVYECKATNKIGSTFSKACLFI